VKQKIYLTIYSSIVLGTAFFAVPVAYAQQASSELVEQATGKGFVPCGNPGQRACTIGDIFTGTAAIINFFIAFAGLYAITFIIVSGIRMVLAAGNPTKITAARKSMASSIIGFVIVLISFVSINTLLSGGSFGLGLKNGANILTHPIEYINPK